MLPLSLKPAKGSVPAVL